MGGSVGELCTEHTGVVEKRVISEVALSVTRMPSHLELPKHRHTSAFLAYVLDGHSTETVGSTTFHCAPGDLFLMPAEEPHSDRVADGGASVFVIEPSRAWIENVREHGPVLERPELLARDRVSALTAQLYRESRRPDAASPLCIQALLYEIGACLVRRGDAASAHDPAWLARVRSRIDDSYAEKLRLSDLAREAGVHSVHLARTFREHYGVSVGQYLRRRRIEAAAGALRGGNAALVDIALDAGFASQAHFCTAFRRLMGCTPSQYRRAGR
jgi:AraC family transcriptional regulator